jgi:hypothetical protein
LEERGSAAVEVTGDDDDLYRLVHPNWVKDDGSIRAGLYIVTKQGGISRISVDWSRYGTPQALLSRAGTPQHKVGMIAVRVTRSFGLVVEHTPIRGNPAHCDIVGQVTEALAKKLAKETRLWIPADPASIAPTS